MLTLNKLSIWKLIYYFRNEKITVKIMLIRISKRQFKSLESLEILIILGRLGNK